MMTKKCVEHENGIDQTIENCSGILYKTYETPPWYLCVMLGIQHYLTAFGSCIAIPLLLSEFFCMDQDKEGISELIGTSFFISGLSTLLQTTFGVRLPIVEGGTFAFVAPTIAIFTQQKWVCPYKEARAKGEVFANLTGLGLPEIGSVAHRELWMQRIREIQGTIILASIVQAIFGFCGVIGFVLRFVGPLTLTPAISLIGLSLFSTGSSMASQHWWIALTTILLFSLCAQHLSKITISCGRRGGMCSNVSIFGFFPVLFSVIVTWVICVILTVTSVLPDDPNSHGYYARTDIGTAAITKAHWFRFPYPGQWGWPTFSAGSLFGMLAGVFIAMIDAAGHYYACAVFAGAPPPPTYAVNRGIFLQGIGSILAGIWGSGCGTSLFGENIGVIAVTKVGSIRTVQVCGVISILFGCFGKFSGLLATIPIPVIGGILMVTFSLITAVGLTFLRHVDLKSSRNIYIVGASIFLGLSISRWMEENNDVIKTGSTEVDEVLTVLLSTSMVVGAAVGFVLDNTVPGSDKERGIKSWRQISTDDVNEPASRDVYHIPLIQTFLDSKFIPICPSFGKKEAVNKDDNDSETGISSKASEACRAFDNITYL